MTRKEVDEIFIQIPTLIYFHKGFLLDLQRGSNIGKLFVRHFKVFEGYAQYMQNCQQTVLNMRKYIRDSRLHICLALISEQSKRKGHDLIDLLLTPLDRMLDYKDFLNRLLRSIDKTKALHYDILSKASRRIGRVATYIEKYKYGICNQNEMNKVQLFLGDQCNILPPYRFIIRRGMMMLRTSG